MKMKKKGFTLVELLGVIVILVLIMLLVFTTSSSVFKRSKKNLDKETLNLIYAAADSYVTQNVDSYPKTEGSTYCLSLNTLVNEGLLPEELKQYVEGEDIPLSRTVSITVDSKKTYTYDFDPNKNVCDVSVTLKAETVTSREEVPSGSTVAEPVELTLETSNESGTIYYCMNRLDIGTEDPNKTYSCNPNIEYTRPFTLNDEGVYYISYMLKEGSNNSTIENYKVTYDKSAPKLVMKLYKQKGDVWEEYIDNTWTKENVKVDLSESTSSTDFSKRIKIEGALGSIYNGIQNVSDAGYILSQSGNYKITGILETESGLKTESITRSTVKTHKEAPEIKEGSGN